MTKNGNEKDIVEINTGNRITQIYPREYRRFEYQIGDRVVGSVAGSLILCEQYRIVNFGILLIIKFSFCRRCKYSCIFALYICIIEK